jgi:hypothetical protein
MTNLGWKDGLGSDVRSLKRLCRRPSGSARWWPEEDTLAITERDRIR